MQLDPTEERDSTRQQLEFLELLRSQRARLNEELEHLDALIQIYETGLRRGEPGTRPRSERRQPRVRGVLAAARKAIDQFSGPFDKNQLLAKLIEIDEEFMHKRITASNIRNALRLLTQRGVIKVESEATATTRARYVKAAQRNT